MNKNALNSAEGGGGGGGGGGGEEMGNFEICGHIQIMF